MALDPSTIDSSNFRLGVSDYFANTYFTDTSRTTGAGDGDTVKGVTNAYGSNHFTEATNGPTLRAGGNGLNGHAVLDGDGTNDILSGATLTNYIQASAFTFISLVKIDSSTVSYSNAYDASAIYGNLYMMLGVGTIGGSAKLLTYQFDGAVKKIEAALTTGSWLTVAHQFDGTNIKMSIGGTSWTTAASGNVSNVTSTFALFRNYAASFYDGRIASLLGWRSVLTDAQVDDVVVNHMKDYWGSGNVSWTNLVAPAGGKLLSRLQTEGLFVGSAA